MTDVFTTIGVPTTLVALAARQGRVFSNSQAEASGVTRAAARRLRRDGLWHKVVPGICSMLAEPPWLALAWAGILQCEDGVLGGRAAGHLSGICAEPQVIEVWSSIRRRGSDTRWHFRRGTRRSSGDPPKTRVEQAALEISQDESEAGIVTVLAKAVGTRRTTAERLRVAALSASTLRHRQLVLDILADTADGVESPLERHYLKEVERAHGLPTGFRQVSISKGTRSDVGYPQYGLLVELDGQLWHEGLAAWTDMARDNHHGLLFFTTLRFGWHAVVSEPCAVPLKCATRCVRAAGREAPVVAHVVHDPIPWVVVNVGWQTSHY